MATLSLDKMLEEQRARAAMLSPATTDVAQVETQRYQPIQTPRGGLLGSTVGTPTNPMPPAQQLAADMEAQQDRQRKALQFGPQQFVGSGGTPGIDAAMAYEDDDVVNQMNRITNSNSDYMRQARAAGLATANRRGLLNSSIAAGASQAAALSAAAPLASQNAAQRASRNQARLTGTLSLRQQREGLISQERMQERELGSRASLQTQQIEAQERMGAAELRSREALATQEIESQERQLGRKLTAEEAAQIRDNTFRQSMQTQELASIESRFAQQLASEETRLGRQLSAQEQAQLRDIASQQVMQERQLNTQRELTGTELASRERIANAEIQAAEARLGRQLTSEETRQIREIASREGLLATELASRETLTREGYVSEMERAILGETGATQRQQMSELGQTARANLDAATRIRTQELANLSDAQKSTLAYYLDSNRIYANSLDNLYANKDMPAPARDAAIQNFLALRNAGVNLPAIIFGTALNWGTGAPTPPAETGTPVTPPVTDYPVPSAPVVPPVAPPVAGPEPLPVTQPLAAPVTQPVSGGLLAPTPVATPVAEPAVEPIDYGLIGSLSPEDLLARQQRIIA